MKRKTFLFILTDKVEDTTFSDLATIFEAEKVGDEDYLVGWSEYGEIKTTMYTADEVAQNLSEGYWEMLTEDEAMKFIKGLL